MKRAPKQKKPTTLELALAAVALRAAARNYAEVADLEETDRRWKRRERVLRHAAIAYVDVLVRRSP